MPTPSSPATTLTGRQKSHLRGLGQRLEASVKVGKEGATPALLAEFRRHLGAEELVKVRFLGAERDERAALCGQLEKEGRCLCVGAVGHTALFYLQNPDPSRSRVNVPE